MTTISALAASPGTPCEPPPDDPGFCGDGGRATDSRLSAPYGVALLPDGGFLVADSGNNRIRRVSASGRIKTVAGTGASGFSGDGGPAVDAQLSLPTSVSPIPGGGFLIADSSNNLVRRVGPRGRITTVAGTGSAGYSGDGGPATAAELLSPTDVAATPDGGFLIADNGNLRVRRVSPDGVITTVAGTGRAGFSGDGGAATEARVNRPTGVAAVAAGGFLVADSKNHRIRRVAPDGVITTVAGTGTPDSSGDGGLATSAALSEPTDVAPRGRGFLIADTGNQAVRRVSRAGTITTVAGSGVAGFDGDGETATAARLTAPTAVASTRGAFVIADNGNQRIRAVSSRGIIATVAGSGPASGDGARRLVRRLAYPIGTVRGYFVPNGAFASAGQRVHFSFVVTKDTRARVRVLRRGDLVRRKRMSANAGLNAISVRRLRAGRYRVKLFVAGRRRAVDVETLVVRR